MVELAQHLSQSHGKETPVQITTFASLDDFKSWKKDVEKETNSWFVQHRMTRQGNHKSTMWFYCSRSGKVRSRGTGRRAMKIQGSSKISEKCSAFMKVTVDKASEEVQVHYSLTHIGHENKLGHLRMSEELRQTIAGKLANKVPVDSILDDIRDNLGDTLQRDYLTSKQDIHNIMHQYNIDLVQRHSEDAKSVHCWVADLADKDYDCILCYKPQGELKYGLPTNDFILGIQTQFQRDTMAKYAKNLVRLDSTHSTTGYDFLLVTVLVKDEFGEGVPVAWLISNREDVCSLDPFFAALKERIGDIAVFDFMSDDAEAFYNAWTRNFTQPKRQLICAWHVDKNLRKNVLRTVKNTEDQVNVYQCVKVLQMEIDETAFRSRLQEFCSLAEEQYPEFYEYFKVEFLNRQKKWAYCYRKSMAANTNMALENFHRVLKTIYFQRKRNKRVDHLLNALLKIARDKAFGAWEKWEKGKRTKKIKEIDKRHRSSLTLQRNGFIQVSESEWKYPSTSEKSNAIYSVVKTGSCNGCRMKCSSCNVCIHEYVCTCPDYAIHSVPCKHVHVIHMDIGTRENLQPNNENFNHEVSEGSIEVDDKRAYFQSQLKSANTVNDQLEQSKAAIVKKLETLELYVTNCIVPEALGAAGGHLNNAIAVIKGMEKASKGIASLEPSEKFPPNKTFDKQLRFFSTKKKVTKKKKVLTKPTLEDKECVIELLGEQEISICGVCFKEDDETNAPVVDWVACSKCQIWVHKACAKVKLSSTAYFCPACNI